MANRNASFFSFAKRFCRAKAFNDLRIMAFSSRLRRALCFAMDTSLCRTAKRVLLLKGFDKVKCFNKSNYKYRFAPTFR